MEITKYTKALGTLVIRLVEKELAKAMTIAHHYSHKWNASFGVLNFEILKTDSDNCLGVAVFENMMNVKSYHSICDDLKENEILELNRLWVDDCLGHNARVYFLGHVSKSSVPNFRI